MTAPPNDKRADGRVGATPRSTDSAHGRTYWPRTIAYWAFTGLVAFEMVAGSLWDLLQIEFTRVSMTHLGFPFYFPYITGVWKLPCAMALVSPRFRRVKEWAYAGAFFNYSGAVASHVFVGDRPAKWILPMVLALFTVASWALRPSDRWLGRPLGTAAPTRLSTWVMSATIIAAMFIVALVTLPKGPPPP